jgi:hypothetical protein
VKIIKYVSSSFVMTILFYSLRLQEEMPIEEVLHKEVPRKEMPSE